MERLGLTHMNPLNPQLGNEVGYAIRFEVLMKH